MHLRQNDHFELHLEIGLVYITVGSFVTVLCNSSRSKDVLGSRSSRCSFYGSEVTHD